MRPITKIFLLIVVALIVFLLWPRSGSLSGFTPQTLSISEVKIWKDAANGQVLPELFERTKVYIMEYGFSPVAALRVAHNQSRAEELVRKEDDSGDLDAKLLPLMQEKYAIIRRETKSEFDLAAAARTELAWLVVQKKPGNSGAVTNTRAAMLAAVYGGDPARYREIARDLVMARRIVTAAEPPKDVSDPVAAAEGLALKAYENLKKQVDSAPDVRSE